MCSGHVATKSARARKVYAKVRRSIQRSGDDPWVAGLFCENLFRLPSFCINHVNAKLGTAKVMYAFQLWILFRDSGILSPDCPLSRVNRYIMSGERRHGEALRISRELVEALSSVVPKGLDLETTTPFSGILRKPIVEIKLGDWGMLALGFRRCAQRSTSHPRTYLPQLCASLPFPQPQGLLRDALIEALFIFGSFPYSGKLEPILDRHLGDTSLQAPT